MYSEQSVEVGEAAMASDQDNLAKARRYFTETFTERRLDDVPQIFAPKFPIVLASGQEVEFTRDDIIDTIEQWHRGFDDYKYVVNHEALTTDGVALLFTTFSGIHNHEFQWQYLGPWAATGRPMSCYEAFAIGFTDGLISRMAAVWSPADLASQLGVETPSRLLGSQD
jgi:hypothetical protein